MAAAAVHVQIHEPRHQPAATEFGSAGRRLARPDLGNAIAGHPQPTSFEHPGRRHQPGSGQHRLAVTSLRSSLVPRSMLTHPLTAPAVRPAEIRLWNSTNSTTTGSEVSVAAAIRPPQSAPCTGLDWKISR